MVTSCFACKQEIAAHTTDQMQICISRMSTLLSTTEQNLQLNQPDDEQALEQFSNTKLGEPSRMGSK